MIGFFFGFARTQVPITDGAFSYDDVNSYQAVHVAGEIGFMDGEGTVSFTLPALTADEQAQVCTTGDLTWEVDFIRTISRTRLGVRSHRTHPNAGPLAVAPLP